MTVVNQWLSAKSLVRIKAATMPTIYTQDETLTVISNEIRILGIHLLASSLATVMEWFRP